MTPNDLVSKWWLSSDFNTKWILWKRDHSGEEPSHKVTALWFYEWTKRNEKPVLDILDKVRNLSFTADPQKFQEVIALMEKTLKDAGYQESPKSTITKEYH